MVSIPIASLVTALAIWPSVSASAAEMDLSGQTINARLVLSQDTEITGDFIIEGAGQIVVEGGNVAVQGSTITWQGRPETVLSAIIQRGGELSFRDNDVTILEQPWRDDQEGAGLFFLRSEGGDSVVIDGNAVTAKSKYAAGFAWIEGVEEAGGVSITFNRVWGTHAGIYLTGSDGAIISDNTLTKVSFGNIVTDRARNLLIERNSIVFHGDGTSGDGLTIVGGSDISIRHNLIAMGTCYGIQMLPATGERMHDITIEGNTISDGITTALYLNGEADSFIEGVAIRGNVLAGNMGWGLLGTYLSDVSVVDNVLSGNAPASASGSQHILGGEVSVSDWFGNLAGIPFTPETTPGRHLTVNEPYLN